MTSSGTHGTAALIETLAQLEDLYDAPRPQSLKKEVARLTPEYRAWIEASPFAVLATSGPDGLDCSPRGDRPGFVHVADDSTLIVPDRPGNNRIDSLRNLVADPRVALMFFVPGRNETIRVNGSAAISTAPDMLERFSVDGKTPKTVLVIEISQVYYQCARALVRSALWSAASSGEIVEAAAKLPTPGDILAGISEGDFDGQAYDADLRKRLNTSLY